jgi:hypothetical protein
MGPKKWRPGRADAPGRRPRLRPHGGGCAGGRRRAHDHERLALERRAGRALRPSGRTRGGSRRRAGRCTASAPSWISGRRARTPGSRATRRGSGSCSATPGSPRNSARRRSTPSAGPAQPPAASARTRRSSRERRRAPFRTTRGGFDDTDAGADQLVEEAPGAVVGLIEGPAPPLDVRVVGDPVNGAKTSRDPGQLQALRLRRPAGRRTDRPPDSRLRARGAALTLHDHRDAPARLNL